MVGIEGNGPVHDRHQTAAGEAHMMGLIDHPLTPLIVAWAEAVQRRTIYFSPKNADAEIVARDLLNAALEEFK
jgi:hypothetical protein